MISTTSDGGWKELRRVASMSALSYDEVLHRARERLLRSSGSTFAGRQRLVGLIEELSAATATVDGSDVLGDEGWRIVAVEVQGYGGIENTEEPLRVELSPVPGVTVVRGDNGTGKSSLAGAVSWLLTGDSQAAVGTTAPGDLWHTSAISAGADRAQVRLVLARGADRLHLVGELCADGRTIRAELTSSGTVSTPELDRHWTSALTASNACFAYAQLRDGLRKEADLQNYLEGLLVLGPAWVEVHETLDARARRSFDARKTLDHAQKSARAQLQEIDGRFSTDARRPTAPPDVVWPASWADDAEDWARAHGLAEDVGHHGARPVAADLEEVGRRLADTVVTAEADLERAEQRVADLSGSGILHHLRALVDEGDLTDGTCPVCGTATEWRDRARATLDGLAEIAAECAAVEAALTRLHAWVQRELVPVLGGSPPADGSTAVAAFATAVGHSGCAARGDAHRAAQPLVSWLRSPEFERWVRRRRSESDASAAWREERRRVLDAFLTTWRGHPEAADAAEWRTAETTLADIQKALREERQDELNHRLREAVETLLPDSGVYLEHIRHKGGAKRRWGLEVELRIGGRKATLGMLSSGQRNALLLASLLCTGGGAPFGFLVVDDPVHALDDLRVDLLARELTRLATERQILVLTHDGRLEEHLRAWNPDLGTIVLQRDAERAEVHIESRGSPWDHLLKTAGDFVAGVGRDRWTTDVPVHDVVGGMCRNAVDGAVRQAVINVGVRRGISVLDALAELDRRPDTRRRLKHVLRLTGGATSLPLTAQCAAQHLGRWNEATHGRSAALRDPEEEIALAAAVCTELQSWRP